LFYFCELYHGKIKQDILSLRGGATKRVPRFVYIIPSTYTGKILGDFWFAKYFKQFREVWQRQGFVKEYVRSGYYLEAAEEASYKDVGTAVSGF